LIQISATTVGKAMLELIVGHSSEAALGSRADGRADFQSVIMAAH
jgi:hypothetical protein